MVEIELYREGIGLVAWTRFSALATISLGPEFPRIAFPATSTLFAADSSPMDGGMTMTTKFLGLAVACVVLLVSGLRFLASPGMRARTPRRLDPREGTAGDGGRGLTKTQAEDLLDWLEAHGIRNRQLSYHPGKGFFIE